MACSCCAGDSLDIFSAKFAQRAMRRYQRKGLGAEEKRMADWAEELGLDGRTVLEVGGGVGALQVELLRRGAASGTVVEVVSIYEPFATQLAQESGVAVRSSFLLADLLETSEAVAPADIVSLRRVVCCSPRGPELLGVAASLTRQLLMVSYPRDRRLVRFAIRAQNAIFAVVRKRFRAFVHDPRELEAAARGAGLSPIRIERTRIWETALFAGERQSPPAITTVASGA